MENLKSRLLKLFSLILLFIFLGSMQGCYSYEDINNGIFVTTIIFDEIDTGISGRIAQCVAEKMYEISTKHQVFCITHLPQIASMSDNHYMVRKKVIDNKTFSKVEPITYNQKIEEVGKMLGGVEMTSNTLLNAKEMIELADTKKETIKTFHT